jgi:hypothetical protein
MAEDDSKRRVCSFCGARESIDNLVLGLTATICHRCVHDFARFTDPTSEKRPAASRPSARPRASGNLSSEVYDARSQAARIIQEAEREAQELQQRALQEYRHVIEEARRKGYEKGLAEGRAGRSSGEPPGPAGRGPPRAP